MSQLVSSKKPMSIAEFLAFTDTCPDGEQWELIDGEAIVNASSTFLHQRIVANILFALATVERAHSTPWVAIPGIAVRLSDISAPIPDILVRPRDDLDGRTCDDIIVAFEVLSPSTARRDLRWKRQAYTALPALAHYVVVAQDAAEALVFRRADGFRETRLMGRAAAVDLPALGISLPFTEIFRDTHLAAG